MRLTPLISGRPAGNSRPYGVPSLVTGPLPNAAAYFEDFAAFNVGSSLTGGHPSWIHTALAGTGTAGGASSANGFGTLSLQTSGANGDRNMVTMGTRTTTGSVFNASSKLVAQFRVALGGTITNLNAGFGLISGAVTPTTDWFTDPDSALAGGTTGDNSIVFTRHAAVYSGRTAGNIYCSLYESTGTDDAVLDCGAGVASTPVKFEVYWDVSALQFTVYKNNVLVGTIAAPSVSGLTVKASFGVGTTTAAARSFNVDSLYVEQSTSSAR